MRLYLFPRCLAILRNRRKFADSTIGTRKSLKLQMRGFTGSLDRAKMIRSEVAAKDSPRYTLFFSRSLSSIG
jgi:hypothetical protein